MLSASIDEIMYEKEFIADENDATALEIRVGSMTDEEMLSVDVEMVDLIKLIIWFNIPKGNIHPVTIIEVGVAWAPDLDIGGVSSIVAQWGGLLSVRSDLGARTCMIGNGKVPDNGGLKCGVKSSAPRSSMITSSGLKC
jgi:hypothetical protein